MSLGATEFLDYRNDKVSPPVLPPIPSSLQSGQSTLSFLSAERNLVNRLSPNSDRRRRAEADWRLWRTRGNLHCRQRSCLQANAGAATQSGNTGVRRTQRSQPGHFAISISGSWYVSPCQRCPLSTPRIEERELTIDILLQEYKSSAPQSAQPRR